MQLLKEGFLYENAKYISFETTVGTMRHENNEEDYSCKYFFIKEEDSDFKIILKHLASLGKLEK